MEQKKKAVEAVKNSDYWKMRFEQLEAAQNRKALAARAEIERIYRQAEREIEGKITTWYQRLADNNGVSMAEARKLLSAAELREFKWDVRDYIKYGKENALTGGWTKELENASVKFHISRFEALKIHIRHSLEAASGKQLGVTRDALSDVFRSGYYHTAYELQKGFGIGWDIAGLDQGHIEKLLSKPWAADGKNFSERIWGSRQKLISEIHGELTRNVMLGQDPQKAIDSIAKKMNTSKYNAGRLVMTEEAYFSSAAQKDCFEELGVEQYEIVATLDSHTSEICRSLDGKHYPMKDFQPGVTAPPFHVNCRSTTIPYFEDDFGSVGKRAARGEDGKAYYVPADMSYEDWKKSFTEGEKTGLQEVVPNDIIKERKEEKKAAEELKAENFPPAFTAKGEMKNTQAFIDYVNGLEGADANVVALFSRMGKLENIETNKIPFSISHAKTHAVSCAVYQNGNIAEVKLTIPKLQGDNLAGQVNTILHEEMHLIDLYGRKELQKPGNWFSTSRKPLMDAFRETSDSIGDDVAKIFKQHDEEFRCLKNEISTKYMKMVSELNDSVMDRTFKGNYNKEYRKIKDLERMELDYHCRNIMGGGIGNLQDIYDALSGGAYRDTGKVIYGHGASYYLYTEERVHETIANYAALSVARPDLIELLRADKPDLVAELEATILELLKKGDDVQ